jgi:hypothetical protein
MGSTLSGRRNGRPLVEDYHTVDLARIMRLAPIREGQEANGQLHWSIDGQRVASTKFRLDFRNIENRCLILFFHVLQPTGDRKAIKQTIALTATPVNGSGHCICRQAGIASQAARPGAWRISSSGSIILTDHSRSLSGFSVA